MNEIKGGQRDSGAGEFRVDCRVGRGVGGDGAEDETHATAPAETGLEKSVGNADIGRFRLFRTPHHRARDVGQFQRVRRRVARQRTQQSPSPRPRTVFGRLHLRIA